MFFLFEDNKRMPISRLLDYSRCANMDCVFLEGAPHISTYIDTKLSKNDVAIVFLDVVPDNSNTLKSFSDLTSKLMDYPKMLLVPILCIEEVYLTMLGDIPEFAEIYDFESALVTRADSIISNRKASVSKNANSNSLEVAMKRVLRKLAYTYNCLGNGIKSAYAQYGIFSSTDCKPSCFTCTSGSLTCPNSTCSLTRLEKSRLLWAKMPVSPYISLKDKCSTLSDLVNLVNNERKGYYRQLCMATSLKLPSELLDFTVYPYSIERGVLT